MGFLKKFRRKLKKTYRKVDVKLGGRLPGGVKRTKKEDKKEKVVSKPSTPSRRFVGPVRPKTVSRPTPSKPSALPPRPASTVTAYQRPKGGFISEKLRLGSIGAKISSRSSILRTEKSPFLMVFYRKCGFKVVD